MGLFVRDEVLLAAVSCASARKRDKSEKNGVSRLLVTSAFSEPGKKAAGKAAYSEHEPEIVPPACVRVGVNPDMVGNQAYKEHDGGDKSLPQAFPESGACLDKRHEVRLRCGAGNKKKRSQNQTNACESTAGMCHGVPFGGARRRQNLPNKLRNSVRENKLAAPRDRAYRRSAGGTWLVTAGIIAREKQTAPANAAGATSKLPNAFSVSLRYFFPVFLFPAIFCFLEDAVISSTRLAASRLPIPRRARSLTSVEPRSLRRPPLRSIT